VTGRRPVEAGDQEQLKRRLCQRSVHHLGEGRSSNIETSVPPEHHEQNAAGDNEPEGGEAKYRNLSQAKLCAWINPTPEHRGKERLQLDPANHASHRSTRLNWSRCSSSCSAIRATQSADVIQPSIRWILPRRHCAAVSLRRKIRVSRSWSGGLS